MATTIPDSAAVDQALLAHLAGDPTLAGWLPDGVWWDLAAPNATRYVVVELLTHTDLATLGRGRSGEEYRVLVLATTIDRTTIKAAAQRIDALLEDAALPIPGFVLQALHREARVRDTEPDDDEPGLIWYHRGGQYRVLVARAADAIAARAHEAPSHNG